MLEDAMLSQQDEITRINRQNLSNSKLSTGETITPKYSSLYAIKKGRSNPDLFVSGGFYESIFATGTNEDEILITSEYDVNGFPLAKHLSDRYTENIYGVPNSDAKKIKEKAFGEVIKKIDDGFKF